MATIEPEDVSVLRFDEGIPGFPDAHRFVISDLTDDGTFQLLTCVDDPERVSLVVTSPWLFFPEYALDVPDGDRQWLDLATPDETVVFCTVTAEDDDQLVLNLRAPFVANARTRAARQVILLDEALPLRAVVGAVS